MATSDATVGLTPDQYGQLHPEETPELLERKLKAFEEELQKLKPEELKYAKEADAKCPELVTDEFKLMFLRCEVFNADVRSIVLAYRILYFSCDSSLSWLTRRIRDTIPALTLLACLLTPRSLFGATRRQTFKITTQFTVARDF